MLSWAGKLYLSGFCQPWSGGNFQQISALIEGLQEWAMVRVLSTHHVLDDRVGPLFWAWVITSPTEIRGTHIQIHLRAERKKLPWPSAKPITWQYDSSRHMGCPADLLITASTQAGIVPNSDLLGHCRHSVYQSKYERIVAREGCQSLKAIAHILLM